MIYKKRPRHNCIRLNLITIHLVELDPLNAILKFLLMMNNLWLQEIIKEYVNNVLQISKLTEILGH